MIMFSFQIGEVSGLHHRVLRSKDLSIGVKPETAEIKDMVNISVAAKRQNIFEGTQNAVLNHIRAK